MSESQNIEYKESWRDEYLKWICGFANAQGGRIYIGINDKQEIVGVADSKRLMEDIPNKIVNYLGIDHAPMWHAWVGAFLCPVLFSGCVELLQEYCTTYRGGDWLDFAANTTGAILASLVAYYVVRPRMKINK